MIRERISAILLSLFTLFIIISGIVIQVGISEAGL